MPPVYSFLSFRFPFFQRSFFHIVPRKRELRYKSAQALNQQATKHSAFCYF